MRSTIRGLCVVRSGGPLSSRPRRADGGEGAGEGAEAADGMPTMVVEFSQFDNWYEVNSFWEGHFLERTSRGAFRKTMAERGPDGSGEIKSLFNHGFDMFINDKALGVPSVMEERDSSPYMEVPLLDTSYNRDLVPGLAAGAYGSSFMFEVLGESWNREPDESQDNPHRLPERTITEIRLYEAGPVTWPANPEATAGLRSGMDWLLDQMERHNDDRREDLLRSLAAFRAANGLRTPDEGAANRSQSDPNTPASGVPDRHVDGITPGQRAATLRQARIDAMASGR